MNKSLTRLLSVLVIIHPIFNSNSFAMESKPIINTQQLEWKKNALKFKYDWLNGNIQGLESVDYANKFAKPSRIITEEELDPILNVLFADMVNNFGNMLSKYCPTGWDPKLDLNEIYKKQAMDTGRLVYPPSSMTESEVKLMKTFIEKYPDDRWMDGRKRNHHKHPAFESVASYTNKLSLTYKCPDVPVVCRQLSSFFYNSLRCFGFEVGLTFMVKSEGGLSEKHEVCVVPVSCKVQGSNGKRVIRYVVADPMVVHEVLGDALKLEWLLDWNRLETLKRFEMYPWRENYKNALISMRKENEVTGCACLKDYLRIPLENYLKWQPSFKNACVVSLYEPLVDLDLMTELRDPHCTKTKKERRYTLDQYKRYVLKSYDAPISESASKAKYLSKFNM